MVVSSDLVYLRPALDTFFSLPPSYHHTRTGRPRRPTPDPVPDLARSPKPLTVGPLLPALLSRSTPQRSLDQKVLHGHLFILPTLTVSTTHSFGTRPPAPCCSTLPRPRLSHQSPVDISPPRGPPPFPHRTSHHGPPALPPRPSVSSPVTLRCSPCHGRPYRPVSTSTTPSPRARVCWRPPFRSPRAGGCPRPLSPLGSAGLTPAHPPCRSGQYFSPLYTSQTGSALTSWDHTDLVFWKGECSFHCQSVGWRAGGARCKAESALGPSSPRPPRGEGKRNGSAGAARAPPRSRSPTAD